MGCGIVFWVGQFAIGVFEMFCTNIYTSFYFVVAVECLNLMAIHVKADTNEMSNRNAFVSPY